MRRIGRNELAVMQTILADCDAQNDYAPMSRRRSVCRCTPQS
ncbi:hypothetical protein J2T05_004886 [Cupriavidus necator]|nr:hypothetical protein [Cupriavidus necator]